MINVKIIRKPKKTATASGGGTVSSPSMSTSSVPYADNAGKADYASKAGRADYAENAGRANYATEAGVANDLAAGAEAYNKFLRKDVDDAAAGEITFNGGTTTKERADFGQFFSDWLLGTGASIDEDGNAEFKSLKVRESLDVAQLVFNKITARDAEDIISPGRGTVESVTKTGTTTGTVTLRLQQNEWATIAAGDICRGIYNNIAASAPANWDTDGADNNGFRKKKGFFTSYFRILNVTANAAGSCTFTYILQPNTTEHPCENMNFAVYGNTSDTTRQNSIYITSLGIAPRIVFLAGVDSFKISPINYKIAIGNIAGIVVIEELADASEYNASTDPDKWTETIDGVTHYYAHKTLEGDAGFYCEDNIYLGGIINQFKSAALDAITAELGTLGQAWIQPSVDSFVVDCDEDGNVDGTQTLNLSARLFYDNAPLELNRISGACSFTYGNTALAPTFSDSNKQASRSFTFTDGDPLSSGAITIRLISTTTGGPEYSAMRTVAIIANRRGAKGNPGSAVRYLGAWTSSLTPAWTSNFRDCVKHDGTYWLVAVACDGSTPLGEPSSSNTNWENIGAMRFVATELLLAESGTIDLFSSNVINLYNTSGIKTASINGDGNGEYCIHHPTGGKFLTMSYDGYIHCYREDGSEAWRIGLGGEIERFITPQFINFPLCSLSGRTGAISENDTFTLVNTYWRYRCGNSSGLAQYDGKIYSNGSSSVPPTNPATASVIPDGRYTPDAMPHEIVDSMDSHGYAITVYVIEDGIIVQTLELTEL